MDPAIALFANEAFYLAFSTRDFEAMEQLWAREAPVVCIHPGWPALADRASVINSWKSILQNPATPQVTPRQARAFVWGSFATVVCYEEIQGDILAASNSFLFEDGQLRMVFHQASPCGQLPLEDEEPEPSMQ